MDNPTDITTDDQVASSYTTQSNLVNEEVAHELKKGIKLPKKESEWATANDYFKFAIPLNGPITTPDLNSSIRHLNDTIYITTLQNILEMLNRPPTNTYYQSIHCKRFEESFKQPKIYKFRLNRNKIRISYSTQ